MQGSHAVLPEVDVNLPSGQRSHVDAPLVAEKEPGRHDDGSNEPTEQAEPAGQAVHSATDWRLLLLEKVPPGHGSGMAAPSAQ